MSTEQALKWLLIFAVFVAVCYFLFGVLPGVVG